MNTSCKVVNTSHEAVRKKNLSVSLDLNHTFMQMPGVRTWPLGSDWLIFLQTHKLILLVSVIGNTKEMVGISVTVVNFAYLYHGKNLFSFQFIHVQDLSVFEMDFASDSLFKGIW